MQGLKPFKYKAFPREDRLTTLSDLLGHVSIQQIGEILQHQDNQFLIMLSNTSLVLKQDELYNKIASMLDQRIHQ